MRVDRIITSAASALGAVTFAVSLAVTGPVAAQTPQMVWVASQPAQPGVPSASRAPDGTTFGPYHAYYPSDIWAAYGVDRLHAKRLRGQGQTIVIVDSYGSPTALEDLQVFSQTFGLPAPDLTIIYPDGKPTLNSTTKLDWADETSLDLQWAHAIAPDAKLVLVAANPEETQGVQGLPSMFKGIAYAVEHYPGSVISQSFSVTEQSFRSATDEQIAKFRKVYQQAVTARCTVLGAISDTGTANRDKQGRVYPFPTVCWPASDPLVTACGGTWLQWGWRWNPTVSAEEFWALVAGLGDWLAAYDTMPGFLEYTTGPDCTEAVWNEPTGGPGWGPMASCGGLSAVFPTPDFQSGLPQSLLRGCRGVPDISWNAALNGGVLVYLSDYSGVGPGSWWLIAGQSASTPQLAGVIALANQLRSQKGKSPIGYLNPVLYTLPARDFNDIVPETFGPVTLDNNSLFGSGIPGFSTTVGWDLTTGLGSPRAYQFVHDLAATP